MLIYKFPLTVVLVALFVSPFARAQYLAPTPEASMNADLGAMRGYYNWLALELRRRLPQSQSGGEARVGVAFKIAPSGRMRIVRITGGTEVHAEILRRLFASIRPPRPPNGRELYLAQDFYFH
ncbi:MAG: hypothetical protein WA156_11645 [Methylocystis silviterrae]